MDKKEYIKLLDTLTDALGRSDGQSIDEIKADLKDDGIDVNATLNRLKNTQKSISMAAKKSALEIARHKRLKLTRDSHKVMGKFANWTREQILERIIDLSDSKVGFAHRDLESMGTEDMAALLEDLEMAIKTSSEDSDNSE